MTFTEILILLCIGVFLTLLVVSLARTGTRGG
jgi:hypothetical protein